MEKIPGEVTFSKTLKVKNRRTFLWNSLLIKIKVLNKNEWEDL
jgi:hypothetical protein